jgi:DNA-directed RNA polymerase subunit RPC12/RpoP
MGIRDTVRCVRCGKDVPFREVRYLPDGRRVACLTCQGIVVKEERERERRERSPSDFQCVRCHHQFRRSFATMPKACPQCSSPKLIRFQAHDLTAGKLLRPNSLLDEE